MPSGALDPAYAREQLWRLGRLRWKLFPDQRPVYDKLHAFLADPNTAFETFYLDITRQWGKTFIGVLVSTEFGLIYPGAQIRYVSYTRQGLREFVHPNMSQLLLDCPEDIKPRWSRQEGKYLFPNGSALHMAGANNGHEDDSRGPRAHLIVFEEAAFVDRLEYMVSSVATPQLTTTGGRILMISTPPETPAHDVSFYKERAKAAGHYTKLTIDQNEHITPQAREKLIHEMGGRDSTKARRELWCEWIVDESSAVVPDFTEDRQSRIVQPARPITWESPEVAMDVGFEDAHAILYGYWDFEAAKLIVQAEDRLVRATTDRIAAAIKATEARLWSERKTDTAPSRWSDVDLRLIADLHEMHRLAVNPTAKDDKEAQVNALRQLIKGEKIVIDPSCEHLIRQLRLAVWNKQRTEFQRTKNEGHFDFVDALIYMLRNADRYSNPYPAAPEGVTEQTHFIHPGRRQESEAAKELRKVFGRA